MDGREKYKYKLTSDKRIDREIGIERASEREKTNKRTYHFDYIIRNFTFFSSIFSHFHYSLVYTIHIIYLFI